jgi:hypothetical protein
MESLIEGESAPDTTDVSYQLRAAATWLELTLPFLDRRGPRAPTRIRREVAFLRRLAGQLEAEAPRRLKELMAPDGFKRPEL